MRRARAASPKAKGRVLYYVEGHLPSSQSFVAQQAKALRRYTAGVLAGRRVASPSASIGDYPVHDISASAAMRMGELLLKLPRLPMPALFPALADADIVHAHFGKNGYVIGPLARAAGKPLVTTFHGFDATFSGDATKVGGLNQARFFARGRRDMAAWPGWTIAVSDFIRRRLIELGYPPDRMVRHYVGIDTALFRPRAVARHPNRVVSIARFVEYKGHRLMIDALAEASRFSGVPVEFVMVGEGPLRQEIEAYARRHLPEARVLDRLSPEDIVDLLAGARLYLHGSVTLNNGHAEALGLANLEAQAMGTPVVAFDSGGVAEAMENGCSGLAVAERDVPAMAEAVASLLTDDARWHAFSAAAAEMVPRRFSIATQTASLEDFYDEVRAAHAAVSRREAA
jgi:colanic acid/amylovoran biosynthesis glycosyltransferase